MRDPSDMQDRRERRRSFRFRVGGCNGRSLVGPRRVLQSRQTSQPYMLVLYKGRIFVGVVTPTENNRVGFGNDETADSKKMAVCQQFFVCID